MLTNTQRDYYDALDTMFATKGWKLVVDEATAQIYQNQADALEAADWDGVCVLRGQSISLNELIKLETISRAQRASLEESYSGDEDADL
jgi:hypothetical protein